MAAAVLLISLAPHLAVASEPETARALVERANAALARGEYDDALKLYQSAGEQKPDIPQLAYNQAVAEYRRKNYSKAAELFTQALSRLDAKLDPRIKYNLGNCAYGEALELKDKPQEAIGKLKSAAALYRDAIAGDPSDEDARANLESAYRMLKLMEQQQEQQQQQQQQNQPSSQPQDQQKQDQQNQEQNQQPSSQPQDQQQQQQDQQEEQQDQQDQQQGEQDQSSNGQPKQQQQDQSTNGDSQEQQAGQSEQDQPDAGSNGEPQQQGRPQQVQTLSREQAERLLQLVRDREKQRREMKQKQKRARAAPVEKDW